MNIFSSFLELLFPYLCQSCISPLNEGEEVICTNCRHELPQTNFNMNIDNKVKKIFYGRSDIIFASSFLYFHKNGLVQNIIHNLKYKGRQEIGTLLGNWYGDKIISDTEMMFDYIIAVPLHKKREKKRGYNQVDKFGEALAIRFNAKYSKNNLVRIYQSETQTKKSRFARWLNVKEIFSLTDIKLFENRNVLLIDDVITTGATLDACCQELSVVKGIKISIITMAISS